MDVHVDRRVELVSILFHFAGGKGYQAFDTPYLRAVETWFKPFARHPAVLASADLRAKYGISFNAPVGLAVFLDPQTLLPLIDLKGADELDERWKNAPIKPYLDTVRAFYTDANVPGFFQQQDDYIKQVEQRLASSILDEKIEEWFETILVKHAQSPSFIVVPGLLTGPWNYEATTHDVCGRQWVYQVIELEGADAKGIPKPTRTTSELVAHEMAHSFVNPVVEQHDAVLSAAAEPLFQHAKAALEKQRYNTAKIMIEESLVRALAGFFASNKLGKDAASRMLESDIHNGFTWILDLFRWLATQKVPLDLEALVPGLAKFFADQGAKAAAAPAPHAAAAPAATAPHPAAAPASAAPAAPAPAAKPTPAST